ncbi:MAG: cystathionine gamma-synthase family protein [Thermoproteota archaeon]
MARPRTVQIHGHSYYEEGTGAFIPPIYLAAIFEQPDRRTGETRVTDRGTELKYSREENPTVRALERVLAQLELGEDALAFSSGMAAITTLLLGLLEPGDEVVVPLEAYGGTLALLGKLAGKLRLEVRKAWPDTESIVNAVTGRTKLVLVETVTNPTLRVIDVRRVAKRCHEVGALLVVDNTFASPVLYNPLRDGAYAVVHSLTKYISGHNDVVGGAVVSGAEAISELWGWRKVLGTIMHPFEAYMTLRGVKTLDLRFEAQSKSALELAEFLEDHPRVEEVLYPGLRSSPYRGVADRLFKRRLYGGVVSFKVRGGKDAALRVLRRVKVIKPSPSLGGTESLLAYPVISAASMIPPEDREKLGITANLLRLSVGLEDVEDLKEDLEQALS